MSYITLGRNQSAQGFNNYRLGSMRSQGMGGYMSYSNSLYGIPSRNGNGSWFNTIQGRSYNYGPVGTYYQMPKPEPPKNHFWKNFLTTVGSALAGVGIAWLASGDNAEKTGNWISNLFSSNKGVSKTPDINENIFDDPNGKTT